MRRSALLLMALAACNAPSHTRAWFARRPEEAAATLNRCAAGALHGADCVNAEAATRQRQTERLNALKKSF